MKAPVSAKGRCVSVLPLSLHRSMLGRNIQGLRHRTMTSVPVFSAKYGIEAGLAVRPGNRHPTLSRKHNIVPPCALVHDRKRSVRGSGSRPGVAERGDEGFRRGEASPPCDSLEMVLAILKSPRALRGRPSKKAVAPRLSPSCGRKSWTHMHSFCKRLQL